MIGHLSWLAWSLDVSSAVVQIIQDLKEKSSWESSYGGYHQWLYPILAFNSLTEQKLCQKNPLFPNDFSSFPWLIFFPSLTAITAISPNDLLQTYPTRQTPWTTMRIGKG